MLRWPFSIVVHCLARAPRLLVVWVTFEACRVHNRDHYGAPTTRGGNQGQVLGTQSAGGWSSGSPAGPGDAVAGGFVVESAWAMTTNEVLRPGGTQWLRQDLVAKRNGLD